MTDGPQTVGEALAAAAAAHPDRDALMTLTGVGRQVWTAGELLAAARSVAHGLLQDHPPGTAIATCTTNGPEAVLLQMGVALAGMVLVPLNPAFRDAELRHALSLSGAARAYVVGSHRGRHLAEVLQRVAAQLPGGCEVVALDAHGWQALTPDDVPSAADLPVVDPDDLAQIQFTSGTTGPAKGVRISHRAMALTGGAFAQRLGLHGGGPWLNPMPLFHTAGNVLGVMGALAAGAPHVVLPFEPAEVLAAITAEQPELVSAAPTLLHLLLDHDAFATTDTTSVRVVFTGGMTVPPAFVDRVEAAFGARMAITFGMTETCGTVLLTAPDDRGEDRRSTVGRVLPHTEVRIAALRDGGPATGEGELCVRGLRVTDGYHAMPEATAAAIDADGWLHTGDLAVMDDRGYCRITGRVKDMIKTGGENVAPDEVESCLVAHPDVAQACVVGVPDERWGELVAAYVTPAAGRSPDLDDLAAHCRVALAPFKQPRRWAIVADLPTTASGKVQRALLRDRAPADPGLRER